MTPRCRGRICPSLPLKSPAANRGRRERRVFGCTRSPVCKCRKHTSVVTADEAETSTFPARWCDRLWRALLGVHDLLVTVALQNTARRARKGQRRDLARLSTSPGVPGPHAFAVRIGIARLAIRSRPSHPASDTCDDSRSVPHKETGRPQGKHVFLKNGR
jgi:hypothetical protein